MTCILIVCYIHLYCKQVACLLFEVVIYTLFVCVSVLFWLYSLVLLEQLITIGDPIQNFTCRNFELIPSLLKKVILNTKHRHCESTCVNKKTQELIQPPPLHLVWFGRPLKLIFQVFTETSGQY